MGSNLGDKPLNKLFGSHDSCAVFQIAIIGCGAAAVATLFGLIECLSSESKENFKITIFEKGPAFGPGFAYQSDNDELLMNMPSSTTSIFAHHTIDFWEWALKGGYRSSSNHIMSRLGVAPYGYISRQFFGLYLKGRLDDAIFTLEEMGIGVDLINLEVVDIEILDFNRFNIATVTGVVGIFDSVILCIGNNSPQDIFNLSGKSQYINNPYPVNNYSKLIKKTDSVGIIGAQLTAADIAVVLANQSHQGPINFFTRDLNFPFIRCQQQPYQLKYLTLDNLEILKRKSNQGVSLRQVFRLARKEFLLTEIAWNKLFGPSEIDYQNWIQSLLKGEIDFSVWQHLAIQTDEIIGAYWDALSNSGKKLFMSRFHRSWATKRVPLPAHTALKLHSLFQAGILKHYPYLRTINSSARNSFTALVAKCKDSISSTQVHCDWLINATGPSRDIGGYTEISLIKNLLKSGLITKNPHGGIMLDYETSIVKSANHRSLSHIYAVGQLTSGTYYFVSSLDMVSLRARNVARHLVESLRLRRVQQGMGGYTQFESSHAT